MRKLEEGEQGWQSALVGIHNQVAQRESADQSRIRPGDDGWIRFRRGRRSPVGTACGF